MSNDYRLWCLVEGDIYPFPMTVLSTTPIGVLKNEIMQENSSLFEGLDAESLVFWKVRYF